MAKLFDERDPAGGRLKAFLFLTHPGPSLLVTAVAVSAVALLERHHPSTGDLVRTGLLMLSAQVAIGTLNDWADARDDAIAKPFKPLPRGMVSPRTCLVIAVVATATSLATGIDWSTGAELAAVLGLAAGIAYDIALKRTALAVVCWWCGFIALLLLVTTVSGAGGLWQTVPLVVLVATALLLANGIPDAEADAAARIPSPAALLGELPARQALAGCLLLTALVAGVDSIGGAVDPPAPAAAVILAVGALVSLTPRRALFPVTALVCALAAMVWFAGLPVV